MTYPWIVPVSVFIGILVSRTTFLERVKVWLLENGHTFLLKGLDCPFCCAFWPSLVLSLGLDPEMAVYYVPVSAVVSYAVGKES